LAETACLVGVAGDGVMLVTVLEKEVLLLRLEPLGVEEDVVAGGHHDMLGVKVRAGWSCTKL